jgi:hypothetical protein
MLLLSAFSIIQRFYLLEDIYEDQQEMILGRSAKDIHGFTET